MRGSDLKMWHLNGIKILFNNNFIIKIIKTKTISMHINNNNLS